MEPGETPRSAKWYVKVFHLEMAILCALMALAGPWLLWKRPANPAQGNQQFQQFFTFLPYVLAALAPVPLWIAFRIVRHWMWLQGLGPRADPIIGPPNRANAAILILAGAVFTTAGIVDGMWIFVVAGLMILTFSIPASLWTFEKQK